MIVDELKNGTQYADLNPRFAKAFEFLTTNDLTTLPLGKVVLEEENMWVNIVELTGNTEENAKMEVHRNYIDIQVPITKVERIGWKALGALSQISEAYNPENDCEFYSDKASTFLDLQPMEFAIFFPQDGHQPGIVEGLQKKIIVKVRV